MSVRSLWLIVLVMISLQSETISKSLGTTEIKNSAQRRSSCSQLCCGFFPESRRPLYSVVSVSGTPHFLNEKSVVDESALFESSQPHDTEPGKGKSEGEGGSKGDAGGRKVEEIDVTE